MSQRYTLVVIDMQYEFSSTANLALAGVCRAIVAAKKNLNHIIVIEYKDSGDTLPEVKKALGAYKRVSYRTKKCDDGSKEILDVVRRKKLPRKLRVCGVNLDACVWYSILGLVKKNCNFITLLSEATYTNPGMSKQDILQSLQDFMPTVCVV
jgi:hypothetical protein